MNSFFFVFRGFQLLKQNRELRKWVYIPLALNCLLIILSFIFGVSQLGLWTHEIVSWMIAPSAGFWYFLVYYPLLAIFFFAFSVGILYLAFVLSSVLAAPFNSLLAENVLVRLGSKKDEPFRLLPWILLSLKMLGFSLMKAALFLLLGLVIFVFSFVPILNLLSAFVAFLIIVFDFSDYSFEALNWSLARRLAFFKLHLKEFGAMALFMTLTGLVPGLTLLLLPLGVVGAAYRVHELLGKVVSDGPRLSS